MDRNPVSLFEVRMVSTGIDTKLHINIETHIATSKDNFQWLIPKFSEMREQSAWFEHISSVIMMIEPANPEALIKMRVPKT